MKCLVSVIAFSVPEIFNPADAANPEFAATL